MLFTVEEFHWFGPQTSGQRRMTSWNCLPPPLKDWNCLSTQSFRITCSAAWDQQAWSPWRSKKQGWFSPNCLAALLGGGQHICILLSRHIQTDWQFLCILQKIKSDPPRVCPCKHTSVFAPGWKRLLEKLDWMRISFWEQKKGEISYPRLPVYCSSCVQMLPSSWWGRAG